MGSVAGIDALLHANADEHSSWAAIGSDPSQGIAK